MNRQQALRTLNERTDRWDVIVIGGGATGLGAGVDAAARGYATLVLEQSDFAKGTSSRSTKLIHGGVRYLAQLRFGLVRRALFERQVLLQNAPHLVHDIAFLVPAYALWELPFYWAGLKIYDLLAGDFRRGPTRLLTRRETLTRAPTLVDRGLDGAILYHDCQFDDARLAVALAQTLFDLGGTALNYLSVTELLKERGRVCGVRALDVESGHEYDIRGRVVVNATGVFADNILRLDGAPRSPLIAPSQGIHIVLPRSALPGDCAVVVPHTDDGRVLFAIPWYGKTLLGTTDTPVERPTLEPRPRPEEIDFLLEHASRYLNPAPRHDDILSTFAGLRPLVAKGRARSTGAISRDHHIEVSSSGLVTISGGKWTTYRHMAEQVIDLALRVAGLPFRPSPTRDVRLGETDTAQGGESRLSGENGDSPLITAPEVSGTMPGDLLHPHLPYRKSDIVRAARDEMARTVEDALARRTRALFLDARASIEAAPDAAALLAAELGHDRRWEQSQVAEFAALAAGYLPESPDSSPRPA